MKIIVDTRIAPFGIPGMMTGMGHMLKNILQSLENLDTENDYTFVGDLGYVSDRARHLRLGGVIKRAFNFAWKTLHIPNVSWLLGSYDIAFFPNYGDFPVIAQKKVVLIADLSYIYFPQFLSRKNLVFLSKFVPKIAHKADHIITISETVKREIVEKLQIEPNRVHVMELAANQSIVPMGKLAARNLLSQKLDITKPYLFTFGTQEPRKNIISILRAYTALPAAIRERYDLIIAGAPDRSSEQIHAFIQEHSLGERVHVLGYIQENEVVAALYSGASLYISASVYEGFGMTILESLKCGTAVLAHDISVYRDTFGEHILYVDVFDREKFTQAIESILKDGDAVAQPGAIELANQFTWERTTLRLIGILKDIV